MFTYNCLICNGLFVFFFLVGINQAYDLLFGGFSVLRILLCNIFEIANIIAYMKVEITEAG